MGLQRWLSVYEHSREDLSLVLSTYMRWFTTICNLGDLIPLWVSLGISIHTGRHI